MCSDVYVADGGTNVGQFTNSSSDFVISSIVSDKDIVFKGNDGGSAVTALTLDMSGAGLAQFNDGVYCNYVGLDGGDGVNDISNVGLSVGCVGRFCCDTWDIYLLYQRQHREI